MFIHIFMCIVEEKGMERVICCEIFIENVKVSSDIK